MKRKSWICALSFLFVALAAKADIPVTADWTQVKSLGAPWSTLLTGREEMAEQYVLVSSFHFDLNKEASVFSQSYFSKKENLEGISGAQFEQKSENVYSVRMHAFAFKSISATLEQKFITDPADRNLYAQALGLTLADSDLIIHQVSTDFSDYLTRSDLITIVQSTGPGQCRISAYGVGIVDLSTSNSFTFGIAKSTMKSTEVSQTQKSYAYFRK